MRRAGVYIHIPFCRSRCSYCDFATGAYEQDLAARYVDALAREIGAFELSRAAPRGTEAAEIDTVYFGGGTPSLLTPGASPNDPRGRRTRFAGCGAEVTLEMNPGTVTPETRRALSARPGINRASFGAADFRRRAVAPPRAHAHGRRRAPHAPYLARGGIRQRQLRSHRRPSRADARRLVAQPRRSSHASARTPLALPARSPRGHAARGSIAQRPLAAARPRPAAEMYRTDARAHRAGGLRAVRDFQLLPARPRVTPQLEILDERALLRLRLLRAFLRRPDARAGPTSATPRATANWSKRRTRSWSRPPN